MIELGIIPRVSVVAVFTGVAASNVGCRLTLCDCAVVARGTCTKNRVVIDSRHALETRGRMAIFTDVSSVDVCGVFTRGVHPVVTRRAVTGDRTVVELRIAPRVGVVAIVAGVRTLYMRGGFSFCNCAVVARGTCTKNRVVIDSRHALEARCRVAIFADIGGVNVRRALACCIDSIVTRGTVS